MKKRIIGLDILRDIGVIFIFFYHFTVEYIVTAQGTDPIMSVLNYFFNVLARPASLFLFLISGYALMYNGEDKLSPLQFYKRRIKGLFLPFYVAYTLMFLICFLANNQVPNGTVPLDRFLFTICGMDGVMQLVCSDFYLVGEWFMSCIVVCYLVFPLFAKLLQKFKYITLAVLLVWYVIFMFFFNPFGFSQLMNPLLIIVYFYMGMLLEDILGSKELPKKITVIAAILSVVIWLYYLLSGYAPQIVPFKANTEVSEILTVVWSFAMILAFMPVKLAEDGKAYRFVTYISGISWYVILLHHRIMILFYSHYSVELYSRRDLFGLLLVCIFATWLAAVVVRNLTSRLKALIFSN